MKQSIRYLLLFLSLLLIIGGTVACRDDDEDASIKSNQSTQFTTVRTVVKDNDHTFIPPKPLNRFTCNAAIVRFGEVLTDKAYAADTNKYIGVECTVEKCFDATLSERGAAFKSDWTQRTYVYFPFDALDLITPGESYLVFLFVSSELEAFTNEKNELELLPKVGVQTFRRYSEKTTVLFPVKDGKLTVPEYVYEKSASDDYLYSVIEKIMECNDTIRYENLDVPFFAEGATVEEIDTFFTKMDDQEYIPGLDE